MQYTRILALAAGMAMTSTLAANAAEVTLSGASCFPVGHPVTKPWSSYIAEVNKRGKGIVQIKLIGGAPAIGSPFTLTQKMARGAYDIVGCTEAYFGNVLPEAPVLRFSDRPFAELRKNGGLAYVQKLMAKKNIHYVARHHDFGKFYLWLSKPISKPDLNGLNLYARVITNGGTILGGQIAETPDGGPITPGTPTPGTNPGAPAGGGFKK